jgi:hypothetical protein
VVAKDAVEGWHLESGLNPLTVTTQRPSYVINTSCMAAQVKATGNILTEIGPGVCTGIGTGNGGGAKIEGGSSCDPDIWTESSRRFPRALAGSAAKVPLGSGHRPLPGPPSWPAAVRPWPAILHPQG